MRAIDADRMLEQIERGYEFLMEQMADRSAEVRGAMEDESLLFTYAIHDAPALDVVPVRHAYWVPCNVYCDHAKEFKCTGKDGCGRSAYYDYYTRYCDYDYCPNCGAKMDAGQEDDNSGENTDE